MLGLIAISTISNFICGRGIYDSSDVKVKKRWLWTAILINIGMLGWFKYAGFFVSSLSGLLLLLGLPVDRVMLVIILPIGISFYAFHSLSYSIDIYRHELEPTDSLVEFAAFVTYFPQMVAGPIVRARELLFQLQRERILSAAMVQTGVGMLIVGFFMKGVVADNLALDLVDPVFANPSEYNSTTLWYALVGYACQIYADFYGYSMIASGSAMLMGIKLPVNFRFPYLATSFSDFWQRWHISMSRFFRDYVYVPLGGNRGTPTRTLINLATTNILSGLWHGANWTFVAWGVQHAVLNTLNQLVRGLVPLNGSFRSILIRFSILPRWMFVQWMVLLTWVVFRCADLQSASVFYRGLFVLHGGRSITPNNLTLFCLVAVVVDHAYGWVREHQGKPRLLAAYYPVAYAAMIIALFNGLPKAAVPFIYFQF